MILARICNIFSDARLYLYVDPWHLYVSGQLRVHEDWGLMATTSNTLLVAPLANGGFASNLQSWAASIVEFFIEGDEEDVSGGMNDMNALNTALTIRPDLSTYLYNRLSDRESIRLLFLSPGEAGTDLQGAIFHTSLEYAGQYNALSYIWGDTKRPHILQTPNGVIPITVSLYSALQRLRLKGQPITLWVDAVCINQDDSEEKSQQVRLMPRIFRSAYSVIADLGEEDDQSHLAMETLLQIKMRDARELPEWLAPVPLVWGGKCIPPAGDSAWAAIDALFSRPWFRRAWVIQEFVAARSVRFICGERSVDWNDLLRAIKVAKREIKASGDEYMAHSTNWGHVTTLAEHREWEAKRTRWPLIHLLESFGYAEATLQRDRLFALLGLSGDGNDLDFQPDYRTDTQLEDIMLRYARKFVKQGKVMNLLHRAGLNSKSERFPSWIPDWTAFKDGTLYDSSGLGIPCAASGYSEPRCNFNSTKDELVIQGIFVDEVTSVSESANTLWSLESYLSGVDKMVDSLREYPTGESLSDLKWKVPIAGAKHPEEVVSAPLDLHASYQALKELFANGSAADILKMRSPGFFPPQDVVDNKKQQSLLTCQNYINALQGVLLGWKFVVTKRGYVGIASNQPQERDLIAIFSGGVVPFLLRKSKRRAGAYHLVGESYVHGIMLGEEWSSSGVGKIRLH
jgi:Heterokaryon incompatibility protein (HET)